MLVSNPLCSINFDEFETYCVNIGTVVSISGLSFSRFGLLRVRDFGQRRAYCIPFRLMTNIRAYLEQGASLRARWFSHTWSVLHRRGRE